MKRTAIDLYLEGMGFRAIGRVLEISHGTVYQRVKKYGESVSMPKVEKPWRSWNWMRCTAMSVEKNYCWAWIAADRYGKRVVDFVCGKRNTLTFK